METMDIIYEKVCKELKEYGEKLHRDGKMSAADWEMIAQLIDVKKNILKTEKLEDETGYSKAGGWEAMGRINGRYGEGYAQRGGYNDGGNSYANRGQHYVRGHYSREGGRRDGMGRYSRDGGKDEMMEHVDMLMETATTEPEREAIRRFKRELQTM